MGQLPTPVRNVHRSGENPESRAVWLRNARRTTPLSTFRSSFSRLRMLMFIDTGAHLEFQKGSVSIKQQWRIMKKGWPVQNPWMLKWLCGCKPFVRINLDDAIRWQHMNRSSAMENSQMDTNGHNVRGIQRKDEESPVSIYQFAAWDGCWSLAESCAHCCLPLSRYHA